MDMRLRALNRFGLGARIGEARERFDPRGWLRGQLESDRAGAATRPDETCWPGAISLEDAGRVFGELRAAQRNRDQEAIAASRRRLGEVRNAEASSLLNARIGSEVPFVERLIAFWSNHLCVSIAAKPQISVLAGHYERTVIRPHALGRFEDMVLASAKHPAMLFYLDNFQSIGPGSRVGRGTARRGNARGLNENHARELLELHTLGVDGGYTQADVEALARILTGWSVAGVGPGSRPDERMGFAFRPIAHEPGAKTVMGNRYGEAGVREGERAIRDLCRHPSTARFVSTKLVRHFVDDDPPDSAVATIERTFLETEGDLREVSAALIDLDEAWDERHTKLRTPQDWLVAVMRAVRAEEVPPQLVQILQQLRHTPWAPASPKGYGDTRGEWADPDGLMNRAELARSLAQRAFGARRGSRGSLGRADDPDPTVILSVIDADADDPLIRMVEDRSIPAGERFALAIGGPAFQWR